MSGNCWKRIIILIIPLIISGCQYQAYVPVRDIGNTQKGSTSKDASAAGTDSRSRSHRVRKGDTLYSIAFRYGYDFRKIAQVNNIKPPYTIYVNQNIVIPGVATAQSSPQAQPSGKSSGQSGQTSKSKPAQKPATSNTAANTVAKTGRTTPPIRTPVKKTPSSSASRQSGGVTWKWPLHGAIIKGFSLSGNINKGVDISGNLGERVNAAADGDVVYAGGNLRGYGKLVIVKHNDRFLSAYGNNQEIRVNEGDSVKQGQMLAVVGKSASNVEMLHFEIRLNGKPVNPLSYLPGL